jgi:hypothetical protein
MNNVVGGSGVSGAETVTMRDQVPSRPRAGWLKF